MMFCTAVPVCEMLATIGVRFPAFNFYHRHSVSVDVGNSHYHVRKLTVDCVHCVKAVGEFN
jgi:hypothetical protein